MRESEDVLVRGAEEIVPGHVRHSAITSQAIGVSELEIVISNVPAGANKSLYEAAIIHDNVLGLRTSRSREWRFQTLRRLYLLTPTSVLFRALREFWDGDPKARPLLACLCALSQDTVFRATAGLTLNLPFGVEVTSKDFIEPIERQYPGVYKASTIATIARKAFASWGQTGHLEDAKTGIRVRGQAESRPENVAYALLLGHLEGLRGEALFETIWARVLDHPKSHLFELALAASQRGMIEYRNAGGVVEVGFRDLLRPFGRQVQ